MSEADFSYDSVPIVTTEIRIFNILPERLIQAAGPIRIKLSTISIHNLPEFKSLSYPWGDVGSEAHSPQKIICNGKHLQITQSLRSALRILRTSSEDFPLWADQICINQRDHNEKSVQVGHMAAIFSRSTCTIAWLGEEGSLYTIAMKRLEELGLEASRIGVDKTTNDQFRYLYKSAGRGDNGDEVVRGIQEWINQRGGLMGLQDFDAICKLCELPYFKRGWIRQEFVLAKSLLLVCGTSSLDGDLFYGAVILLKLCIKQARDTYNFSSGPKTYCLYVERLCKTYSLSTVVIYSVEMRYQYQTKQYRSDFNTPHILRLYRFLEFQNEKDRVYGILGIITDRDKFDVTIDYSDLTTWQAVYMDMTKQIVQNEVKSRRLWGGINFLRLCGSNPPGEGGTDLAGRSELPSWVPNLMQQNHCPMSEVKRKSLIPFDASRGHYHPITRREQDNVDRNVLLCRITVVDRIVKRGSPGHQIPLRTGKVTAEHVRLDKSALYQSFESIIAFAEESYKRVTLNKSSRHPYCCEPGRLLEAFWRVPILDHEYTSNARRAKVLRRATNFSRDGFFSLPIMEGANEDETKDRTEELRLYMDRLEKLRGRSPFLGENGFVGIGPTITQEGDLICVIHGGFNPFVLREKRFPSSSTNFPIDIKKKSNTCPLYEMLGEAYCDGIMDGEVFTKMDLPSQIIKLI